MKKSLLLLVVMTMLLFHSPSFGHGIITHLGLAQNIIDRIKQGNSGIPDSIASIITKNPGTEKAFKGGALDSDLFALVYPDFSKVNRSTHENCSILIASILLKNAKTDVEKAYAYGWALAHLPSDVIGHPLVNIYSGNGGQWGENEGAKWDYDSSAFKGTNGMHVQAEYQFDGLTLDKFGYDKIDAPQGSVLKSRLNLDIDIPIGFLQDTIIEGYGEPPGALPLYAAELLMQAYLEVRADRLANSEPRPQDTRFDKNFQDSLDEVKRWMNNPAEINANYSLDDGSKHEAECQKMTVPIIQPGAGGDHSDDTAASSTLEVSGDVSFEDWLRIGIKKGNRGALLIWELRNKLDALKALPEGADPILRYQKEQELIDFVQANMNNAGVIEAFRETNEAIVEDLSTVEEVGILNNGFSKELAVLTVKLKEPTARIPPGALLQSHKDDNVIIIPSGGLYGLENSEFFKASLDEYVKQGGTLIVFGQQHGYEFSVLPVPQEADGTSKRVAGYGWTEDQSCQYASSYIDTWHQILSGQSKFTPNINVDGYFTDYPSNTIVLLRRTANGQPDLLMYEHGQGRVIVTSMYSDFALKQNQAFSEEIALIRDIISWAKKPNELPEIKPGQSVSVPVLVTNNTTNNASSVRLLIYNPSRTILLSEQVVSLPVTIGQSVTIPITFATDQASALGIYHIDYVLYDSSGKIIQPQAETDSGRFIVSNPPINEYEPVDLFYSINTPREEFLLGQTIPFTVTIWNNSNVDKKLKMYWDLSHLQASYLGEVTVAGHGSLSETYTVSLPRYSTGVRLWLHFFEEDGTPVRVPSYVSVYGETWPYVGSCSKGIGIIYPSIGATIMMGKPLYSKGENVIINTSFKNEISASYQTNTRITITDPKNAVVFEDMKTIALSAGGTTSFSSNFALSSTSLIGTYIVKAEALYQNDLGFFLLASTRFELPESQISIQPNLPSVFSTGANSISFALTNTGRINLNSGTIDLGLKSPDGSIVYSGSQSFSLAVGEAKQLDLPISVPSLKLGNYILSYSQSDETRMGRPISATIPNSIEITNFRISKPSFKVGDTANLSVDIKNTGKFTWENILVTVSAPVLQYSESQTMSLEVSASTSLNVPVAIPETISAGLHDVDVTLTLPGGDSITKSAGIFVPASSLLIGYRWPNTLSAGDILEGIIIENVGGFDTNYNSTFYLYDKAGWDIDIKTGTGFIQAGGQTSLLYTLPNQLTDGWYQIGMVVSDTKTGKAIYYNSPVLNISGLKNNLSVNTDRDIYFPNEEATTLSTLVNQANPMVDGNLHLEIACSEYIEAPEQGSFHIFTYNETTYQWAESGVLHFPGSYEQQELFLPISPDQWGYEYLRIKHDGAQPAFLDYIALRDDNGNLYPPYFVGAPEQSDITSDAQEKDGVGVGVTGQTFYVEWENLPSGISYTLVMVAKEGCGIVWQTDVPINQGSEITQNLNISAGTIGQTGKYYLSGTLSNTLGQIIGTSSYPFYIIDGDTVLIFNTDKRIYRPGEAMTITGKIENRAPITAENLILTLTSGRGGQNPQLLLTETINLLSGGNYPLTITTTAGEEGIFNLSGAVMQNNQTLISITDQYEVANPLISTFVDAPQTAGNEPFNIEVDIYNDGKVDATVQFGVQSSEFEDSQTVTIPAFGMKLLQYSQQISKNTSYTFTFTGDYQETITNTVSYALGATLQLGAGGSGLGVFPEGDVAIPIALSNTGQSTETLEVTYQLNPGAVQQSKTYSLPAGGSATDTLYFNLTEGDYQITATSQKPDASAQTSLSVRKKNQVQMGISLGTQTDGLVPVDVNLTNDGFNEINGSITLSVTAGSGQVVWSGEEILSQLSPQNSQLLTLNINPSAIDPGNYNVQVTLLNNSNQSISTQSLVLGIQGPTFQITQLPPYQTFNPGQEATLTFRVKNTGNQEGSFDLRLKAYDLSDSTQKEWLKPNEEKDVTFGFMLPEDLEEKDYFADYELKASVIAGQSKGQIKYHLVGISLSVNASLDKSNYNEGETAHLTINIQSPNSNFQNLFARVNYAGYEPLQTFTLSGNQVLIFDIPLPKITGEKLFYGIYHEGGRSIHLNSVYIHQAGDVITITTNKQVYNPGETVSMSVIGSASGDMTLSAPGGYAETFAFTGSAGKSFTLPATVTAGTYFINIQLTTLNSELVTAVYPFDIAGIQVKVVECNNDKGKYASSDTIATAFTIQSNMTMPAILKAWIVNPTGQYTSAGEQSIALSSSETSLITYNSALDTSISGIHRLVYGIYGPEDLLFCSGSEAFDVGDAVLLGISTDKVDYPQGNESVLVKAGLYGSVTATLEFYLDGQSAGSQSVSLHGFSTLDYILPSVTPGPHTQKVVLTAGGLTSTKETTFTYGSGLSDLTLQLSRNQVVGQSSLNITITAANQGKSPSGTTTLHLYDGEISGGKLLSTFYIPALSQSQSQTLAYELNLLGRTGTNTLSGIIDPSNNVYEFNESNNGDQITFAVPDITFSTALEKDVYFTGETVFITSLITNLSKDPLAGLVLFTEAKDQADAQVFANSQPITTIEAMVTANLLTSWPTNTQLPEGVYTIHQSIAGKEVHSQKSLTFIPGKDFTITTDTEIKKIEVGEAAEYQLLLTPLKAFKGEINLSLSGYPQNSTVYFTPNPVTITEGQARSILTVIPPNQTVAGSYPMKVNATGGEISRDVALSLNITDFEMILHPTSQTLRQLEKASYTVTLNPFNGFDHGVTLEVYDIPPGMRASLSAREVALPQSVTLNLETSKWLLPGEYRIPIVAKAMTITKTLTAILIVQSNLLNVPGIVTVPGLLNKPIIHTFNLSGGLLNEFQVVDGGLGVNLSAGDVNGDGVDEVIAATGWKLLNVGRLGVFRRDGTQIAIMETEQGYVSDLTVTAGDFDGDWIEEVVVGSYKSPLSDPLHGGGGVKVYKIVGNRFIDTGLLLRPYESEGYFGPPNLAVSDVDGDGMPELITAPGPDPRAPAKIKVFKIDTSAGVGLWKLGSQIMDFIVPFNVNGFGARVAAADLDGNGCAEIIVGAGPDPRKKAEVVIVYHGDTGYEFERFTAYPGLLFGVNVAAVDVDGDGISEILTGPGPDLRSKSKVRIFRRDGTLMREFQAYPDNIRFGVKVSAGRIGE